MCWQKAVFSQPRKFKNACNWNYRRQVAIGNTQRSAVKDFRFIYSQSADGVPNYVSDIQPQVLNRITEIFNDTGACRLGISVGMSFKLVLSDNYFHTKDLSNRPAGRL